MNCTMTKDNKVLNFKPKRTPQQISFAEIDPITQLTVATYSPNILQDTYLSYASAKYADRSDSDSQTWLDRPVVYVGLSSWVTSEAMLDAEELPYTRVPFSFLRDLMDASGITLRIAVPYNTEEQDNLFLHTNVEEYSNTCKIKDAYMSVLYSEMQVKDKSAMVCSAILTGYQQEAREALANVSLAFGSSMAKGLHGTLELVEETNDALELQEAQKYWSKACTGLMYHWALGYFTDWEYYFPEIDDYDDTLERFISSYPNSIGSDDRLDYALQMVSRTTQRAIKSFEEVSANT